MGKPGAVVKGGSTQGAALTKDSVAGSKRGRAAMEASHVDGAAAAAAVSKAKRQEKGKGAPPAGSSGSSAKKPLAQSSSKPTTSAPAPAPVDIDALFSGMATARAAAAAAKKAEPAKPESRMTAPPSPVLGGRKAAREGAVSIGSSLSAGAMGAASASGGSGSRRVKGADSPPALRWDATLGMNIYKADALKMDQPGGDTPDCPFDCTCCY